MAQIQIPFVAEHAEDVLSDWLQWHQDGPVCLVMLTQKEGGGCARQGP